MSWRDPNWKYVRSEATDIRKTIAKARKRLESDKRERQEKLRPLRKTA